MGKKEYATLAIILVPLICFFAFKVSHTKRQLEIKETRENLKEIGKQVEQYYTDDADLSTPIMTSPLEISPVTWNFLENQPNWILKPSPDHNEKTANGLNIRIASSSSTAIQNTKDSWSSDIFKSIHIQIGPVFEKLDIEITLKNEAGEIFIINGAEKLKEGINSISLQSDKNPTGEIKDTEIRFYNKESRNLSSFSLIAIQLTP